MPTASARCRVAVVGAATVAAWLAVAAMSASTADAAAVLDGDYGERQYSAVHWSIANRIMKGDCRT